MSTKEFFAPRGTMDCPIGFYEYYPRNAISGSAPHCQNELEITICQKGSINVTVKGQRYHLLPGHVLIIAPMEEHTIEKQEHDTVLWQLIFSKEAIALPSWHIFSTEFADPIFSGSLFPPRLIKPDHPAYPEFMSYIQQLPSCRLSKPGWKLRRYGLVVSICNVLVPYCTSDAALVPDNIPQHPTIKKLVLHIRKNLTTQLTLEELAKHSHLQANYMCALFKKYMNESIFSYIIRSRVEYAAVLLRSQELSVGDIAGKAGFTSESSFHRKFKEHFGVTPLTYRKTYRK